MNCRTYEAPDEITLGWQKHRILVGDDRREKQSGGCWFRCAGVRLVQMDSDEMGCRFGVDGIQLAQDSMYVYMCMLAYSFRI